ncbi:hypothetical protein [Actinoplanes rectilineatus]|uniref:hypothetical protein n=1 Tax=Actinoplanes rectilineatus TaxID=113571 RepID=UPI0005F2A7AF|nr:hypothetical protein [Actinoplanes rectilineatus]
MKRTLLLALTPAVALILTPSAAQADDRPPRTVSVTVDLDYVPWQLDVLPPGAYPSWVWPPQGQAIVTLGG